MFDYIKGNLTAIYDTNAVVDISGIGYKIITTSKSLQGVKTGDNIMFYTYLHLREDIMDLYGFTDLHERSTFMLLISVSGVGPKAAISLLSALESESLALAVISGDVKTITTAPGIGQKLAQRIVLELKDKIKASYIAHEGAVVEQPNATLESEAVEALIGLGYTPSVAVKAIKSVEKGLSLEETIKKALSQNAM
ncbi:MAG: Holliday junction branch migration protein RuvA [Firmicutes bacterium]|nr:Holliday junction branch migration protein RuvA [Bacillota bacterium]